MCCLNPLTSTRDFASKGAVDCFFSDAGSAATAGLRFCIQSCCGQNRSCWSIAYYFGNYLYVQQFHIEYEGTPSLDLAHSTSSICHLGRDGELPALPNAHVYNHRDVYIVSVSIEHSCNLVHRDPVMGESHPEDLAPIPE